MIGPRGATRAVHVMRRRDGETKRMRDALAVEEPLEIRIAWTSESGTRVVEPLAVTMRTPGDDFELVAGFLHGEGVVSGAADLAELTYCRGDEAQEYNIVEASLAPGLSFDPRSGIRWRHHLHQSGTQRAIRRAVVKAKLTKRVSPQTFRHAFAPHRSEDGADIRTVQTLLGHKDVKTTMIYTHVLDRGPMGVRSPIDRL